MRHQAIYNTHSNARGIRDEVAYDKDNNPIVLDEAKVKVEEDRLVAAYNSQSYARSRKAEYPPWDEQLDHIYHNGIASWKANMVKPVKDKYPKP